MRNIGDILYINMDNEYYGKKCKITKINKVNGETSYDIELLEKNTGWLRHEGMVKLSFSNVHYCNLKDNLDELSRGNRNKTSI